MSEELMPPRYEIPITATKYRKSPLEREPTSKTRVLNVDRSQMCFLSHSLASSRENSFEKEFDADEDQIFNFRKFAETL